MRKKVTTNEVLLTIAFFFTLLGLWSLTKNFFASALISAGYFLSVSRLKRTP